MQCLMQGKVRLLLKPDNVAEIIKMNAACANKLSRKRFSRKKKDILWEKQLYWEWDQSSSTTLDKKKNHPRDSRRDARCSTCDTMLDQARSAQGKSRGSDLPCADRAWSSMISHVEQCSSRRESRGWFFFFVQGSSKREKRLVGPMVYRCNILILWNICEGASQNYKKIVLNTGPPWFAFLVIISKFDFLHHIKKN